MGVRDDGGGESLRGERDGRPHDVQVGPPAADELGGLLSARSADYEGGFLLMAVDHERARAADWHRSDFV